MALMIALALLMMRGTAPLAQVLTSNRGRNHRTRSTAGEGTNRARRRRGGGRQWDLAGGLRCPLLRPRGRSRWIVLILMVGTESVPTVGTLTLQ